MIPSSIRWSRSRKRDSSSRDRLNKKTCQKSFSTMKTSSQMYSLTWIISRREVRLSQPQLWSLQDQTSRTQLTKIQGGTNSKLQASLGRTSFNFSLLLRSAPTTQTHLLIISRLTLTISWWKWRMKANRRSLKRRNLFWLRRSKSKRACLKSLSPVCNRWTVIGGQRHFRLTALAQEISRLALGISRSLTPQK